MNWVPLYDKRISPTCDVLHADTQGTPFSTTGTLILRGMTRTLFVSPYYQTLHLTGTTTPNPLLLDSRTPSAMKSNSKWRHNITYASRTRTRTRSSRSHALPVEFFPDEILDTTQPILFLALGSTPAGTLSASLTARYSAAAVTASRSSVITLALQATPDDAHTFRRVGMATWNNCAWFGYFCVGESAQRNRVSELLSVWEGRGFLQMLMAVPAVLWVWVLGTVFGLAVMRFYDDGVVWFGGLVKGGRGRHGCGGDVRKEETYRAGCGVEERTVRVV